MNEKTESGQKGGLYVLDSNDDKEFQSIIELFSILLEIKNSKRDKKTDLE